MTTITRPCSKPILTKLPRMPLAKMQTIPGVRQEHVLQIACKASHLQSQVVCKTKPGYVRQDFQTQMTVVLLKTIYEIQNKLPSYRSEILHCHMKKKLINHPI
jgi:hypothetical protein